MPDSNSTTNELDEVVEVPQPTAETKPDATTKEKTDPLDDGKLKPHHKLFLDPYAPEIYETRKKSLKQKCIPAQKLEEKAHEELCAQFPDELVPAEDFLPSAKLYFKNLMRKFRERDEAQAATQPTPSTSNRQQTIEETLLPKVTPRSLYKFENHDDIVEIAVEKAGKDNKRTPAEYQKTRKEGYDSLPVETKKDFEERANRMNHENAAATRRTATDEEIIQNQLTVRDRIKKFLQDLIGEGYLQIGGDVSFHLETTYACRRDGGVPVGFVLDVLGKSIPSFTKSRYYKKNGNGYAEFSDVVFRKLLEKRQTAPSEEPSGAARMSAQDTLSDTDGSISTDNTTSKHRDIPVTIEGATTEVGAPTLRHLTPHEAPKDDHTTGNTADQIQASPTLTDAAPTARQFDQVSPVEEPINTEPSDTVVHSATVPSHSNPITTTSVTSSDSSANLVRASEGGETLVHANAIPSSEPRTEPVSTSSNGGPTQVSGTESVSVVDAAKEQSKAGKRTKAMVERSNEATLRPRLTRSRANKPVEPIVTNSPEKGRGKRVSKLSAKAQAANDAAVKSRKRGVDENANEATTSRKKAKKA
ncbi:hypothetical protein SCHPADRAFT_947011 [Schizopora paradoxa]|uniref:Uncharacterized protein n=1 Tax=Schizopora paradoxa TaxID=27342 RepID=A0A0H2RKJ0_9AGAM|nr:hypothetical protein SCHPADRAFT_947011 [Schizopora paradoxa]